MTFTLTDAHVALLRAAHWQWNDTEFGAPEIDPKRPFGFSGGYWRDMARIVGWVYDEDDQQQEDELWRLWKDGPTVLAIGLATGSFEPGEYERDGDGWRRVEEL